MTQTTDHKNEFAFDKRADYKSAFKRYVDELFARAKRGDLADRAERIALIDALIESYIAATGQRPDSVQLDRLATLCLREELTDKHDKWKAKHEEYPFLSDSQYLKRTWKDVDISAVDATTAEEGKRRTRTKYENNYMDKTVKSRENERRKRYRDFKNGKSDGILTVNIKTGEITRREW